MQFISHPYKMLVLQFGENEDGINTFQLHLCVESEECFPQNSGRIKAGKWCPFWKKNYLVILYAETK